MALLTSRTLAQSSAITPTTLIHIVTTADTSQSSYGSSYKAELQQLQSIFGSNPDLTVTGGTYNPSTGIVTFYNNTGGTFDVSGFITGFTDSFVSGGTYSAGTATFTNTTGGTFTVTGFTTPFTGNTSATCISDLYVSNLYGCSPIIIHDNLVIESGVTITSTNGGGQIELDYALQPSNILISTDNGGVTEAFINLQPTDLNLSSLNGDVRIQSLNSNNFRSGNLFSNMSQILMEPDFVKIGVVAPSAVFSNDYESVVVYNTLSSDQATSNANKWPVTVSSKNSTILSGVRNSVILGGSDITASTNNTVYVDNLNINTVGNGTSVINLGLDSNGFVVTGTTFSGGSGNCITDLYISNIHSCSPLNINPLDEGNVYFGSTSGITVDLTNVRLGIGTSSPTKKLDVNGTTIHRDSVEMSPSKEIFWSDTSTTWPTSINSRIRWTLNNDSAQIYAYQPATDDIDFVFKITDNSTDSRDNYVFWIDDNGGESFDRYPLEMNGLQFIVNPFRRYATIPANSGAGNTNFYVLQSGATSLSQSVLFANTSTGNVGIGTSSPTYKLQVNGTYGSMSYDPNRVRVSGDTDAGTFDSELLLSGTTSGITLVTLINGINSLGLISIGDDSGSTIYGNGGDTSIFNSSAARNLNIINSNGFGNDNIRFYAGQTASGTTPDIHIQGSGSTRGYVGIGTTSPSEKLDVSGKTKTINFQMTSGATLGYVLTSDASGNASWQASTGGGGVSIDPYNNVGNTGTSFNWDVSGLSTNYEVTLTANTTLNLTNVRNGDYGTIILTQDGTGGRTLTFGTVNGSATTHRVVNGGAGTPTLTSNASAIDILTFTYNGSVMYWTVGNDYN